MAGKETKERIFEETARLFSEKGYPLVPLKDTKQVKILSAQLGSIH